MMSYAPSLKAKAAATLELRRRQRQADPVDMPVFRGAALSGQSITEQEWILAGPAETGKTFATLWRLDTLLRMTPKAQAALVRKVAADVPPTVLKTYQKVIERSRSGAAPFGGSKPEWYDYPNGARLYIGGMDRPGKVLSGERDWVYVNQAEELTIDDWETLTTRTTGRGAVTDTPMLFGDCNPGPPNHWIINRPSLKVLHSRHEDNPSLFDEAGKATAQGERTIGVLDRLTGVRNKRLRWGLWVAVEGTVYDFDRAIHLKDRFVIPAEWRRYRVIDFGYTNPFCCQWWAIDHDGRAYLYREIYMTGRTVQQHAQQIKELSQGEAYVTTLADHDAEDRATLHLAGILTQPAHKPITAGIQAVQERLRLAGDDKPRLMLLRDSLVERDDTLADDKKPLCTEHEFDVYAWPKGADGKARKEMPVDDNNHGMDCLRYLVAQLDLKQRRQVRSYQG